MVNNGHIESDKIARTQPWIVRFYGNFLLCAIASRVPGVSLMIKTENNWQVVRLQVTM